ncbi:MAG: DUF559 domain-containing protein [Proteobacteria bacterium]|nr:DUF559 domain-containing protein [Pseudomonadota bacterium]
MSYRKLLYPTAKELRNNLTEPEKLFWDRVRSNKLSGVRFHRQRILGPYIVDFYAPSIRLVVEIDGSQHFEASHFERDIIRDEYLKDNNIVIKRYSNLEIYHQLNVVIDDVYNFILKVKEPN